MQLERRVKTCQSRCGSSDAAIRPAIKHLSNTLTHCVAINRSPSAAVPLPELCARGCQPSQHLRLVRVRSPGVLRNDVVELVKRPVVRADDDGEDGIGGLREREEIDAFLEDLDKVGQKVGEVQTPQLHTARVTHLEYRKKLGDPGVLGRRERVFLVVQLGIAGDKVGEGILVLVGEREERGCRFPADVNVHGRLEVVEFVGAAVDGERLEAFWR